MQENHEEDIKKNERLQEAASPEEANDFEFLQEKIKERPIDKKKLLRKLMLTASMALLFGLIACLTILLLEPVLNNWLYPEEEPDVVIFPEEAEEILPEDMLSEENEKQTQTLEADEEIPNVLIEEILEEYELLGNDGEGKTEETDTVTDIRVTEYQLLYQDLYNMTMKLKTSMVTVTGVSSDVDWFNNPYESEGESAGLIIADNGKELLVLCNKNAVQDVEMIHVAFCDKKVAEGTLKKYDENTGLAVIAVDLKEVSTSTRGTISIAQLGSSNSDELLGQPIIAIGQVNGYGDSVSYGMLTSTGHVLTMADNEYKLLTTDIFSCKSPSGILVNMNGEVIGIIKNDYNSDDSANMLSAIGISELKGMISKLSNNISVPYLGIYTMSVPEDAVVSLEVPQGAYITDIDMDSPAMRKGMQKGDIIVAAGDTKVTSAAEYMAALRQYLVNKTITVTVLRPSQDAYQEMTFDLMIETKE